MLVLGLLIHGLCKFLLILKDPLILSVKFLNLTIVGIILSNVTFYIFNNFSFSCILHNFMNTYSSAVSWFCDTVHIFYLMHWRNDPLYISSLGMTVLNVCRVVPHGILVFFPSYPVLYKCREEWQQSGLWSKIAAHKVRSNFILHTYFSCSLIGL